MTERLTPYTADEQRVSDYIQEMTDGMIGSGDDPIGFLIASHQSLRQSLNEWTAGFSSQPGLPRRQKP